MGILNIQLVERGESKALIALSGLTGSGKTKTALYIARGMVDKPSEIGFLDTENKRGTLYADSLDGQFMYGELIVPHSPKRYRSAIEEFEKAGVKVLIIDSVSHEWAGEGGCEDIANAALENNKKVADWISAKREHKKFMKKLLNCSMHLILCLRAKEKTDFTNPKDPISLGILPICEKDFMFEMMAHVMVENKGKTQILHKIPQYLESAFGDGKNYLNQETGKAIMNWLKLGKKEDPELLKYRSEMMSICEKGIDALRDAWAKMPKHIRAIMDKENSVYVASAQEYDLQRQNEKDLKEGKIILSQKETISDLVRELGDRPEKEFNEILLTFNEMTFDRAEEAIKYLEVLKNKGVQTEKVQTEKVQLP